MNNKKEIRELLSVPEDFWTSYSTNEKLTENVSVLLSLLEKR